jgi:hypothetical protein
VEDLLGRIMDSNLLNPGRIATDTEKGINII